MAGCACGCGKETVGGVFVPGHDQRLRTQIENQIGGLLRLRELVDSAQKYASGELETEPFTMLTRRLFSKATEE